MTPPIIFGLEWECAVGGVNAGGAPIDKNAGYESLRRAICELSPWAPDLEKSSSIFTPGFRFYQDCGQHPEVAGVEVASPQQLLDLKQAIFTLLAEAARRARRQLPGFVLVVNNHDYLAEGTFWGCHESYSLRCPPDRLARGMAPFLASRCLLAGSGRIDARGRVLLSPRAQAMRRVSGGETTTERALFSTCRQEPLMGKGPFTYRLHLICGDACSLRGAQGEYLKVATTALVLLWLQHDPAAADDLTVCSPLRLLRAANVLWTPRGRLHICPKAIGLQRAYQERVARFVDRHPDLPDWCAAAVDQWEQTLKLLASDPLALTDRLDPFIKLALFDAALTDMNRAWGDIAKDSAVYHELAMLDIAYHRLGDDEPSPGLGNHVAPLGRKKPPALADVVGALPTRAAPRGRAICEHFGKQQVRAAWHTVHRFDPMATLDLADPTTTRPEWKTLPREPITPERSLSQVLQLYDRGAYEQAHDMLVALTPERSGMTPAQLRDWHTYSGWVESRRGTFDGIAALDVRARTESMSFGLINDYVCAYRYLGLASPAAGDAWIERGLALATVETERNPSVAATFLDHVGNRLLRYGKPQEAIDVLRKCHALRQHAHPHVRCRILTDLADAERMLGHAEQAHAHLNEAEALQVANSYEGDRADYTWTIRGKLEPDPTAAPVRLEQALAVQVRLKNVMAEVRTRLLLTRIRKNGMFAAATRTRIVEARASRPALDQCQRLASILKHWKEWCEGAAAPDGNPDAFWGI